MVRLPRSLRRRIAIYGGILAALLVVAIVFDARCFIESRCFYFPLREAVVAPRGAEDVSITTPDGLTLHGWYFPPRGWQPGDPPAPTILHVHGNAGHIGYHIDFSEFLPRHGFGLLIFDYRGFGRSDLPRRALQREDLLIDTLAALDALLVHPPHPAVDSERIAIYGVSLGGVLGLAAAAEREQVRAVVSIAAFASWRGIVATHGTPLARVAVKSGLDAVDSIAALGDPSPRPVLVVHGAQDTIVPPGNAELLVRAAEEQGIEVELLRLTAGHNDIVIGDTAAQQHIADFLARSLGLDVMSDPER